VPGAGLSAHDVEGKAGEGAPATRTAALAVDKPVATRHAGMPGGVAELKAHAWQAAPPAPPAVPLGHGLLQLRAPSLERRPAGHTRQSDCDVAPSVGW
jgi:hypothetical protein